MANTFVAEYLAILCEIDIVQSELTNTGRIECPLQLAEQHDWNEILVI